MVYKSKRELIQDIDEWMQHEGKVGKDVSAQEIASHFGISLEEAREIHEAMNCDS
jgi:DNA-directed RNA polymerase specialized sigma subunit